MDVKLSSQRTCQNSVIKILLAVGAGIWGEGACPPRPRVAVSQVSRCLPGLPSPPAFPEQQASWLPGPCLSRFLKELSAPAGFPRCPGPLTCARPRARGSQAACPLGRGFGGRRCPCHGGGKQTGPSEDRSALGRTLPGRAEENKQERGVRMRVVCPEWGGGVGGVQPGLVTPSSSTGISEQGVTRCRRARGSEGNSFPSTPKSSLPEEGLWKQCYFPGTVSCPG